MKDLTRELFIGSSRIESGLYRKAIHVVLWMFYEKIPLEILIYMSFCRFDGSAKLVVNYILTKYTKTEILKWVLSRFKHKLEREDAAIQSPSDGV